MNRLIFGALALWVLLASPLTVAAHDKPSTASIDVDCNGGVTITFETAAAELTYMILSGDTTVVDKTTVEADGQVIVTHELPDGDYTLVWDPENVIDNSFQELPFNVDCPKPTPTPSHPTTPPTTPPTAPPPSHHTLPPSDTAADPLAMAVGPNPLVFIGLVLIAIAALGMGLEARNRRR